MFVNEVPSEQLSTIVINELRDIYGIKYRKDKKTKSHQNSCDHKIFGVSLKDLEFTEEKLSNGSTCRIPIFVADACSRIMDQIDVEGLFRKAGSSIRQKEIRENLEKGIPLDESCNVIDVANILKYFLRELPEALLPPGNFQEAILRCLLCKGTQDRKITAIKMVCLLLPNIVLNTLAYFLQFLNLVSLHSASNKMSARNLAIIFTPGLMPVHENYGQRLSSHVQIIEILIESAHEIGLIPPGVIHRLPNMSNCLSVDAFNATLNIPSSNSRQSTESCIKVPETDVKKKKKRRSGSLTRMFSGIRKIVNAIGSSENLDDTHESEVLTTPCINKSKKRKVLESSGFSSKKKKDVLALLPGGTAGGILPSTPMLAEKPSKKSRLSLGGKRYSKNGQTTNGPKSSIVSSLERRWSFMVTGSNNRQNNNHKSTLNSIKDTSILAIPHQPDESKMDPWDSQITKSEYEEIKDRVKAIETRISQEFTKIQSSLSNNSMDSVDLNDSRDGPERVLKKFEKTLEETEAMNTSPSTEQLARRLSRGLKIRSSVEGKVIRSPSARKIGSIRRRSQENHARVTRNKSWHLGSNLTSPVLRTTRVTRNSPSQQPAVNLISPNVEKHIQIPRVNLKRGRPNTAQNGLRFAQPDTVKTIEIGTNTFTITENARKTDTTQKTKCSDLKNEKWICADVFFAPAENDETSLLNTSKNNVKLSATKPARKRLNMNANVTPTNQQNSISNSATPRSNTKLSATDATPMLPPRFPMVKKTPAKTPHPLMNRNMHTPLWQQEQQQIAGRASIARLRQNAGMVMAKAKLFEEKATEPVNVIKIKPTIQHRKSINQISNENQENKVSAQQTVAWSRLNDSLIQKSKDSPRRNISGGVQRRQQLRANNRHTPNKRKTPINLDKNLVTLTDATNRNISSPVTSVHNSSLQSPMTRRATAIEATPHAKRSAASIAKPPRRIIRTPQQSRRKLV